MGTVGGPGGTKDNWVVKLGHKLGISGSTRVKTKRISLYLLL